MTSVANNSTQDLSRKNAEELIKAMRFFGFSVNVSPGSSAEVIPNSRLGLSAEALAADEL